MLKNSGIKKSDTVLIHTSMRSLGEVEGGCDDLIDAFVSYLTEGLFLVATHTWKNVTAENPVYDVRNTVPCIGVLPTVAAFRKDAIRSLHPTHSVVAFGNRAKAFVAGEENAVSPCTPGGVWARLYDENAKILLLGVGLNSSTYIHTVDEMLDLPERLQAPISLTVIDYDGNHYALNFSYHGNTGSRFFENYRKPPETFGALKNYTLGTAKVGLFYAREATDILKMLWSKTDHNLCEKQEDVPESYYL